MDTVYGRRMSSPSTSAGSEHPPNVWTIVRAHKWSDATYRTGLTYARGSERLDWDAWTADARYQFRRRMRWYESNEDGSRLVFRTSVAPPDFTDPPLRTDGRYEWTVVPESEAWSTLHRLRADPLTTAFSRDGLYAKAFSNGFLGISRSLVRRFLDRNPPPRPDVPTTRGAIQSYRPKFPLEHWQMDLIVMNARDLREANKPYEYILVVVDLFSKYTWLRPLKRKTPDEIAGHLQSLFFQGEIPQKLQTDQGTEFQGVVSELLARFHVTHILNDPYSPQTNGVVENRNKTIKTHIWHHFASFVDEVTQRPTRRYVDVLDRIAFNLNNTKHTVTKLTPFQVHRGVHVRVPTISRGVPRLEYAPAPTCESAAETEATARRQRDHTASNARVYEARVRAVRDRIHDEASRRESRRATDPTFQVGSVVKVRTAYKMNERQMQFVPLRIGTDVVPARGATNPVSTAPFAFATKWMDRTYPETFVITQVVTNAARTRQFVLVRQGDPDRLPVERMRAPETWESWFPAWTLRLASTRERRRTIPTRPTYADPVDVSLPDPVLVPRSVDYSRLRPDHVRAILRTGDEVVGRRIRQWWRIEGTDRLEPYEGRIVGTGRTRRGLPGWIIRYEGAVRGDREYDIPLYPTKYNKPQEHEGWIFLT